MSSVQIAPVWTPDRARLVLSECVAMVTEIDPPDDLRIPVFQAAAAMLSNVMVQQGSPVAVPLPGLTRRNGR